MFENFKPKNMASEISNPKTGHAHPRMQTWQLPSWDFNTDNLFLGSLGGQHDFLADFDKIYPKCHLSLPNLEQIHYFKYLSIEFAVGPKRSTNRTLKQIITIECTKTVIFRLLRPLDISKLAKGELIQ